MDRHEVLDWMGTELLSGMRHKDFKRTSTKPLKIEMEAQGPRMDRHGVFENGNRDTKPLEEMYEMYRGEVIWGGATPESATWELEEKMRESYPDLFVSGKFEDEFSFRRREL
ncbi:hypothetical protein CR513_62018, partial [Mucuna pruriens]